MEHYQLSRGEKIPEVYHFGFNGTHFQFFLQESYWKLFVEIAGEETYFALRQESSYLAPTTRTAIFGFQGCAKVNFTLDENVCIEVPSFLTSQDDQNSRNVIHYAMTIKMILLILRFILDKVNEEEKVAIFNSQLFTLETYLGPPEQHFHGAGLELTLSPSARVFLEKLGDNVCIDGARDSMSNHYNIFYGEKAIHSSSSMRYSFRVNTRTNGILHLNTIGDCACIGAMPKDFTEVEGCHLHSHNVDTTYQQFNLLVGIAYIWQMVRNGLNK